MASFDVYTTDANPRHVAPEGRSGDVDRWVDQLARVSTYPVDLFVDVPNARVTWTFQAAKQGTSRRTNNYLADYRGDPDDDHEDLFGGLYTEMSRLSAGGVWEFPDDPDSRWEAGFELPKVDADCPGLTGDEEDALVRTVSGDASQVVLGMSSYGAALATVKRLAARGVDGTVAVNTYGATPETEGIDLVLWPGGDRDFQPMNAETKDLLSRVGFRPADEMTVADATPSESIAEVEHRRETPSPLETFVGDTAGRIGAALTLFFASASLAGFAGIGPFHPLSGLSAVGGTVGALVGLVATQQLVGADLVTDGGVATAADGESDADGLTAADSMLATTNWEWQQYAAFVGYWTTAAYAFPTVFRLADWPFGATITPGPTLASVLVYAGGLLAVVLTLYGVWALRSDAEDHAVNVASLVVLHASFALGIVAFAGLACGVWYGAIGFDAPAC